MHRQAHSFDAVAVEYAERFRSELEARPLERAMLAAFAELVRGAGAGAVAAGAVQAFGSVRFA